MFILRTFTDRQSLPSELLRYWELRYKATTAPYERSLHAFCRRTVKV
jgi:hypothetical protein